MSPICDRSSGRAQRRDLAQLGRAPGPAQRPVHGRSSGASGRARARATYAAEPGRAHEATVPARSGAATRARRGARRRSPPRRVAPRARARPRSARAREAIEHRPGILRPPRPGPGARSCRASAARRRRPRLRPGSPAPPSSARARLQRKRPGPGACSVSRASASSTRASVFGPTPGALAQPPVRGRLAEFLRRAHAEGAAICPRALGAQAEVAPQADEVGRQRALELGQLGDLPVCTSSSRRPAMLGTDAPQLARPSRGGPAPPPGARRRGSSRPPGGRPARCRGWRR